MIKTKEPKTPFKNRKHSDKIVASIIATVQVLMLGICSIFAYMTVVDNSTASGEGGTPNIQISAGASHTLAVVDGALYAWGSNSCGQLGDGTGEMYLGGGYLSNYKNIPVRIGTETNWVSVSAGRYHSLAINSFGELWSWGYNYGGCLGLGDEAIEYKNIPTKVGLMTNWVKVSAGQNHSLAINNFGEIWAWGENSQGQLGIGNTTTQNKPIRVGTATNWVSVSAGWVYSIALNDRGELWAWGSNNYGQHGDGSVHGFINTPKQVGIKTNWVKIYTQGPSCFAINSLGELWAWGYNYYGQLGDGTTTDRIFPIRVGTASNWVSVSAGSGTNNNNHTLATNSLGELWAWGYNGHGQLGDGTTIDKPSPVKISDSTNWVSVFAGSGYSLALKDDGELYAFGSNYWGMLGLGLGANDKRYEPTSVTIGNNVIAPNSTTGYTISEPSATYVAVGGLYAFTLTVANGYTAPIVALNSSNGKINLSSINNKAYTYTVTNVTGEILAADFTISVSKTQ